MQDSVTCGVAAFRCFSALLIVISLSTAYLERFGEETELIR